MSENESDLRNFALTAALGLLQLSLLPVWYAVWFLVGAGCKSQVGCSPGAAIFAFPGILLLSWALVSVVAVRFKSHDSRDRYIQYILLLPVLYFAGITVWTIYAT